MEKVKNGRKIESRKITMISLLKSELLKECPFCKTHLKDKLGKHILIHHGKENLKKAVAEAKEKGFSDEEIGKLFGITFKQLENLLTQAYGLNISVFTKAKKVTCWEPKNFKEETTTVWSFKQRGNWATHEGKYRGNWSPYIPRNIILKYSNPGDTVLDYFIGSGTTAVEAKLTGRKCIGIDINPKCIELNLKNLQFIVPKNLFDFEIYEPVVKVGDARNLLEISDESVDLICSHPPYAGIIKYSCGIEGDLSQLSVNEYIEEMKKVAQESYRVLKPGKKCVLLIGDTRKNGYIVPIGFRVIDVFTKAGFKLKELVIKQQHNCKTTGFWRARSLKYNFLLLAHEYLPVFEKPKTVENYSLTSFNESRVKENFKLNDDLIKILSFKEIPSQNFKSRIEKLETTSVWRFPRENFEECLLYNLINRYQSFWLISFLLKNETSSLLTLDLAEINFYLKNIVKLTEDLLSKAEENFIIFQTQDTREGGYIIPLAKMLLENLLFDKIRLKEIIIAVKDEPNLNFYKKEKSTSDNFLKIIHTYLLIYKIKK